MAKKQNRKKPAPVTKQQDSVFKEAWENMSEDMAKFMPDFISKGLQGGKKKLWVVIVVTCVELVVLGAVGKFAYDWFVK